MREPRRDDSEDEDEEEEEEEGVRTAPALAPSEGRRGIGVKLVLNM